MNQDDNRSSELPELEDTGEAPVRPSLPSLDVSALFEPFVARAVLGVVLSAAILLWPGRTPVVLSRFIGLALVALAGTRLWAFARRRSFSWPGAGGAVGALVVGGMLTTYPDRSRDVLGLVIGVVLVTVAGFWIASVLLARRDVHGRGWVVARSLAVMGVGALLLLFPAQMLSSAVVFLALGWLTLSGLVIVSSLTTDWRGRVELDDSVSFVGAWLASRPKSLDDRSAVHHKLLFDGAARRTRTIRFLSLMTFASIIASMGIVVDSTAVVIGAMLIAPLMTPLMAMALSLVMGWPHRLGWSMMLALTGVVLAIAVAFVLGASLPVVIDTSANAQILARTTPTMLDLIIALAAGAAGAYGLSRPDVSDALPGVAVSISLVPPLTVVGLAYSQGDFSAGNGALLLFTTNMLAILAMGGCTFIVTGVAPIARVAENQFRVRTATAALVALGTFVLGALMLNGIQIAEDVLDQSSAERAVNRVVIDHVQYEVVDVMVADGLVIVTIVGPATGGPTVQEMAAELATVLGREVTVELRVLVQELRIATVRDN